MRRIISVALLLCTGVAMTAHAADEDPPKVVKIRESIYMAPTTGNVYLVTTPAGNVVIDTALAGQSRKLVAGSAPTDSAPPSPAEEARKLLVAESHGPVKYIILTHGHADHIGGINLWKEPGTQIIAQRNYVELVNYVDPARRFLCSTQCGGIQPSARGR